MGAWRRAARRARAKVWRVGADLALVDRGLDVRVEVLDRVLDRDDVDGLVLVDLVDDRREGRGLARAGRAGHQHDAVALVADLVELRREPELLDRGDLVRDDAQDDAIAAALREDVHAEAGALWPGCTKGRSIPFARACPRGPACRPGGASRSARSGRAAAARSRRRRTGRSSPSTSTCGGRPTERLRSEMPGAAVQHRLEQRVEIEVGHQCLRGGDDTTSGLSFPATEALVLETVDLDAALSKDGTSAFSPRSRSGCAGCSTPCWRRRSPPWSPSRVGTPRGREPSSSA